MRIPRGFLRVVLALALTTLPLSACNQDGTGVNGDGDGGIQGDPGEAGVIVGDGPLSFDGGVIVMTPDGGTRVCNVTPCQNHVYQCGDCMDNDGDKRIDSDDPECLGPCDNSEDGLTPNIPGGNNAPCKQDCYFDQDTGSGNDACYWDHRCDPHQVPPGYHPEGMSCRYDPTTKLGGGLTCASGALGQSKQCNDFCGPLTPNGCDCFGCCNAPNLGPQVNATQGIWLGSRDQAGNPSCTLSAKDLADPNRCRPCQIVPACHKTCGRCQLCIGKDTLPPDCFMSGGPDGGMGGDGGGGNNPGQCPPGVQACGLPGQAPCPNFWYCITGCCQPPIG